MKVIFKFLKPTLKLFTSGELVEMFDKDGDGKVTRKELWQGIKNPETLGELVLKFGGLIGGILLLR